MTRYSVIWKIALKGCNYKFIYRQPQWVRLSERLRGVKMVKNTLKLQEEISRLDSIIGEKYLGDGSPVPKDQLHIAYMWLENDISSALSKAEDMNETFNAICKILQKSHMYDEINEVISLHTAYRRAEVRKDFADALRNVKNGAQLSGILGWSFSDEDLTNLARLHKSNKFRKKIEDLLTDCNFHEACGLMSSKNYSKWL